MSTKDNEPIAAMPSRDSLRAKIFSGSNSKKRSVTFNFNGVDLEWRQPSIREVQTAQADTGAGEGNFMTTLLISHTFIPGTEERVFEEADRDSLENMPFGGDWQRTIKSISDLLDLSVEDKAKN